MVTISRRAAIAGGLASTVQWRVAAAAKTPLLPFLVLGDWGRDGTYQADDVAQQMGRVADTTGSQFTISVGDNFYENGVTGVDDPKWQSSFERVYRHPALMRPWHVVLGNHDYRGSVEAQLSYRGSPRWHMPDRYYTRSETLSDGTRAEFFHIDTSPFVTRYLGTRTHIQGQNVGAQLTWLDRALGTSTAMWKIVVGHHPIFTATGGKHDTLELVGQVKPILDRHGVHAYFCGHIHNLQEVRLDGVCYVTSGAGSQLGRVRQLHRAGFAAERHGFVLGRLDRDVLVLSYVDETGTTLQETTVRRGRV